MNKQMEKKLDKNEMRSRIDLSLIAALGIVLGTYQILHIEKVFAQDGKSTPGANAGADLPPADNAESPMSNQEEFMPTEPPPAASASKSNSSKNSSSSGATAAKAQDALTNVIKSKLGDYVDLDDSIKNETYGSIEYANADLKEIVTAIAKLANKNFILDSKINNRKITIISHQNVTKQEAYNAFLSALYMNGFTVVAMGPFLKIIEAKDAIQSNIRVFMGDFTPNSEEVVTVLYPLKFLNADEIQRFLTDLVPRNGRISSYPNTNTLVMTDTGVNLRRIVGILKSIDVPGHEDQLENIPIRYASAKGVSALIDDILEAQSGTRRAGAAVRNQPQKTRGGGIITKIVPDERTNSLVVLANGRGVQELKNLVSKLDTPDAAGGGNIHIYFCKNAVAEELAGTINNLISGNKPSSGGGGAPNPIPSIPGAPSSRSSSSGGDGIKFEGNLKITFDKPSNSLVVVASGSDFAALKSVLRRLDIPRRQVYVEGTIMEISVTDERAMNVGFLTPVGAFVPSTATPTLAALVSNPAGLTGAVTMFQAGKSVEVTLPSGNKQTLRTVTGLIRAIQEAKQGNILHQPQILTSDNQDAEIKITNKVPVNTGSVANATGQVTASVGRENIEIGLKITPQIGRDNDLVKLKVEQQVDDFNAAPSTGLSGQIETTTRKAVTTVVARSSDTIVIGGLQKNVTGDTRSKFPLIGDLPVIGWFFKGSSSTISKSNLVLFLTPHIINEYSDLIKLTQEKLGEREKLGMSQYDPKDNYISQIEKLKAKTEENLSKPEPRGWGFSPSDSGDPDPVQSKEKDEEEKEESKSGSVDSNDSSSAYAQALSSAEDEEQRKKRALMNATQNGSTNTVAIPPPALENSEQVDLPLNAQPDSSAGAR